MPISCFAASRGSRVSVSSVMQYRTDGRMASSPTWTVKLVSVAPLQQPVELLDLAAFALPPHPRLFLRIPAPVAMEQKEAIGVVRAEPPIEVLDAGARGGEDGGVVRQLARFGVGEVAEDREMDVRIEVAEREHLDVLQQRRHRRRRSSAASARRPSCGRRPECADRRSRDEAGGEAGSPRRSRAAASAIAMSAAGISSSSSVSDHGARGAARVPERRRRSPPAAARS